MSLFKSVMKEALEEAEGLKKMALGQNTKAERVCCGCGVKIGRLSNTVDYEDSFTYRTNRAMFTSGKRAANFMVEQNFKFKSNRLCENCFRAVLESITDTRMTPEDYYSLEDFKVNHINEMIGNMSPQEIEERVKSVYAKAGAVQQTAEDEWLKSLK